MSALRNPGLWPRARALPLLLPLLLAALLLAGGCERKERVQGAMTNEEQPASAAAQAPEPPPPAGVSAQTPRIRTAVEVMRLQPQDFTVSSTYIGHLLPRERVELRAEIEGVAERVLFEEGQQVGKEQLLVNISTEQLRVRRDQARADLELAQTDYDRQRSLHAKRLVPEAQLDQSRTRRDQARYALQLAEIELKKSFVTTPIAGTVKTKGVNRGEYLNKGQFIAEILDISGVKALVDVPEREVRYVRPGRKVDVAFEALPGESRTGEVSLVGLEADTKSRTFPVEVTLDNGDGHLRPGMLVRVHVALEQFHDQLLVPRHAILERETGRVVFVARDGTAEERPIVVGASSGEQVQVLKGLSAGENLVVTGQQKLTPGEPIDAQPIAR